MVIKSRVINGFLLIAVLMQPLLVQSAGVKFSVELRLYHYPDENDLVLIEEKTGRGTWDDPLSCRKHIKSASFELALKLKYQGTDIEYVKSRCVRRLPTELEI